MEKNKETRREFISKTGIAAASLTIGASGVSAKSYKRILGANDKVRMGFIGVGNRGTQVMHEFMAEPDCEIAGLSDVYEPYLSRDRSKVDPRYIETRPQQIPKMGEDFSNKVGRYSDYRKLLDDKNIDAVYIGTPDHWHALQTIDAFKAGKMCLLKNPLRKALWKDEPWLTHGKKASKLLQFVLIAAVQVRGKGWQKKYHQGKLGKLLMPVVVMYPICIQMGSEN